MNGAVHIDLSKVAAETVGWKGDVNLLARSAAYPDEVASVVVDGVGAHLFGRNLESLTHFDREVDGKAVGYGMHLDPSMPHLGVSGRKVAVRPEAWPWPVDDVTRQSLPLAVLLRDLAGKAAIQADEITYPAASTMAHWCEVILQLLPANLTSEDRQRAFDTVAGWGLHYIEDCCVPHHAGGMLLAGHAEFEAAQQIMWERLRARDPKPPNPYVRRDPPMVATSLRALAKRCAEESYVGRGTLRWRRWIWRRGWRVMMLDSLTRGLDAAITALRNLKRDIPMA